MTPTNQHILDAIEEVRELVHEHIMASAEWRLKTETELRKNTEVTEQIEALATTGKTLRNIVIWVGGAAAALVGIVQLYQVLTQIGPTP